jgi:hypothetical protein
MNRGKTDNKARESKRIGRKLREESEELVGRQRITLTAPGFLLRGAVGVLAISFYRSTPALFARQIHPLHLPCGKCD